jgi:hypothetical protein
MALQSIETKEMIPVAKSDIIAAWSVIEKMAVSLHRMGSYYSVPTAKDKLSPERHLEMLESLSAYMSPELVRELFKARRLLTGYLADDEAEAIADRLEVWRSPGSQ